MIKFSSVILLIGLLLGCSHVPFSKVSPANLAANSWLDLSIIERNQYLYYDYDPFRLFWGSDYCEIDLILNNKIVETRNVHHTNLLMHGVFASFLIPVPPGIMRIDIEYSDCRTDQDYRYTVVEVAPSSLVSVAIEGDSITTKTRPYIKTATLAPLFLSIQ